MQRTHPMFADVFYGVFGTEAEAEAYATYGDQRLWALVTFHEVGPCTMTFGSTTQVLAKPVLKYHRISLCMGCVLLLRHSAGFNVCTLQLVSV